MTDINKIIEELQNKINLLIAMQKEQELKIAKMEKVIQSIEKDIYLDDEADFEIVCPYCNNEFCVDVDEERTEVTCPECNNVVELDWTGDLEDSSGCAGHCGGCSGCGSHDDDSKDEDDDM